MLSMHPRSPDELAWAEDRLKVLGFRCITEGKTLIWVDEHEEYVVYADHRMPERINFEVWRKPLPKNRPPRGLLMSRATGEFYLLDSWKHDLPNKYAERVAMVLSD